MQAKNRVLTLMLYGFDIGGTKIEIAAFNHHKEMIWHKRVPTPQDSYTNVVDVLATLVEEADNHLACQGKVGLGLAGIVNHKNNTVFTTNIAVLKHKPLLHDLSMRLQREIRVENDANCFALSEAHDAEFMQYQSVLGIILGTGLGGGLVINGQIYSGMNGVAAEIGHLRLPVDCLQQLGLDIPLVECGCGQKGCCERYLSGTGFEWLYHYFYGEKKSAREIVTSYYEQDEKAGEHVARFSSVLATYLGNICMLFDPELIVLGGGLSNFEALYPILRAEIAAHLYPIVKTPRIEKARYGDAGGVRGAAFLNI